jgi:hypothetical protein
MALCSDFGTFSCTPLSVVAHDYFAAMGTWSMWTLARTGVDGDPIVADVVVRVKYFYIVTLVLNIICSGTHLQISCLPFPLRPSLRRPYCVQDMVTGCRAQARRL